MALANPLDYHTYIWGDEDAVTATFTAMMDPDLAIGCVVLDFPRSDRCDAGAWEHVIRAVVRTKAETGRPMAILGSLGENMPEPVARRILDLGIVPFSGMAEAIEAMEIAAGMGQTGPAPEPLLQPAPAGEGRTLTEAEAKAALAAHGLRVPAAARAKSVEEAVDAAARIGFPVVLKGEGIAHKTEAGAVALNLRNADAVRQAAGAMPTASFLVEEMVDGSVAELLVGVVSDPAHGYVLTLAAGGTLTELMDDSASLLLPATREELRAALGQLRYAPLLTGYRGAPAADIGAVIDAVMAVQACVAAMRPLEIEINPLLCGPDGAVAADALIRIGDPHD